MKSVFDQQDVEELKLRIERLDASLSPSWGKMNASQMLAHCNVVYEMTYDTANFKKPNGLKKWFLKTFLKPFVIGDKPYKRNSPTSPEFKVANDKDFGDEKKRLLDYLEQTLSLGKSYFDNKENFSFGAMKSNEWDRLFYKHLDHHLTQFGV